MFENSELVGLSATLSGNVVFAALADYHVDTVLGLAGQFPSRWALIDLSQHLARGTRAFRWPSGENFDNRVLSIDNLFDTKVLRGATAIVSFNDTNYFIARALNCCAESKVPSIAVVEGVADFARALNDVEFQKSKKKPVPYSNSDAVFLMGPWGQKFFPGKPTYVVGSPRAETLYAEDVVFPSSPTVLINQNFSYGVLRHAARSFLSQSAGACQDLGLDFRISQHPQDSTKLGRFRRNKTRANVHDSIREASVVVSRFSTVIVDALAMGKPVIYFNPHGEPVNELLEPFGAFEIARDGSDLREKLAELTSTEQEQQHVRQQAAVFLQQHAGIGIDSRSPAERFSLALQAVITVDVPIIKSLSGRSVAAVSEVRGITLSESTRWKNRFRRLLYRALASASHFAWRWG
jgi:hypothetical protein